jgi:hypothetical protein
MQQKYKPTTPNNKMGHFYILQERNKENHKTFQRCKPQDHIPNKKHYKT